VLTFMRDTAATLPDELTLAAGVIHGPDGSKLAAILGCHCGSLTDGEAAIRPITRFGPPVMNAMGPMAYSQVNMMLDAGYPKGALTYWKSTFLDALSDDAIRTVADCYERCPSPMSQIILEHFHGAVTRVPVAATAFPHRRTGFNLLVLGQWAAPADTDRCVAWVRETYGAMERFRGAGRYVNYLADDEEGDPVAAAYGPSYDRLREIKTKYDPANFFHLNQNIRPLS
jgi:hypothetical protein